MNVEVRATKLGRKVAHSSSELQRTHVVARFDPCTAQLFTSSSVFNSASSARRQCVSKL